jgi:hypothetical protein
MLMITISTVATLRFLDIRAAPMTYERCDFRTHIALATLLTLHKMKDDRSLWIDSWCGLWKLDSDGCPRSTCFL